MTISEMLQTPEKYIPYGMYCYHHEVCPFWTMKEGEYPKQEDGYCHYLQKSDWELNEESSDTAKIVYSKDGSLTGMTVADLEDDNDIDPISGKKFHFPMSLLWDQCKECDINTEDPEDIELVRSELDIGEEHD
jgi:hypothetical protein